MESVSFLSEGQRIDGTLTLPEKRAFKIPGVIFFPGMTSNQDGYISRAQRLAENGIAGLALSLRGHGTSEGNFNTLTIHDMVKDGLAAYDFLIEQEGIDPERIGICGTSVGADIACIVSKERPVQSLLLRAPALYSDQMMNMTFAQTMAAEDRLFNDLENLEHTPPLKAISIFEGSLLIVVSGNDLIVPARIPQAYFSHAAKTSKKEIVTIKGADHALQEENLRNIFVEKMVTWFSETLNLR